MFSLAQLMVRKIGRLILHNHLESFMEGMVRNDLRMNIQKQTCISQGNRMLQQTYLKDEENQQNKVNIRDGKNSFKEISSSTTRPLLLELA